MNNLEKIEALEKGGWLKCLDETVWVGNDRQVLTDADLYREPIGKSPHEHALYNAAKVEVTKAVLDEVYDKLNYAVGRSYTDCVITTRETIKLIQKLKEVL